MVFFAQSVCENNCVIRHFSSTQPNCGIQAHLIDNGAAVVVLFDEQTKSKFDACFLWSNDPSWVHPTSGQRLRTPGQYSGVLMIDASIVNASNDKSQNGVMLPFPLPPEGSCHPVGNLYKTKGAFPPTESHLLRVTWKSMGQHDSAVSYYDLEWLRHWRYDKEALDLRRTQTMISAHQTLRSGTEDDGNMPILDYSLIETNEEEFAFRLLHVSMQ